jgi:hypothetical protein
MKIGRLRTMLALGLLAAGCAASTLRLAGASGAAAQDARALTWYKGNTHTHTVNSDGDSTPDEVVRWYREHGYHFLVLTDHNYLTSVDGLNAVHGALDKFIVVPGEEVTSSAAGKPVHVNGLAVREQVAPPAAGSVLEMLQRSVDGIRAASGVPHINHPNFGWAITPDELRQVERTRLLEIFNGHPRVNGLGGGGWPGLEEMWDRVLSSGRLMYGLAVDDAHYFKQPGNDDVPGPGRGWVVVWAPVLSAPAIMEALEQGQFYSSTGVELTDVQATDREVVVDVKATTWSKYRVQFIGRDGRVLDEQSSLPARYVVRGDEGYVRAKVIESNGRLAWTQPRPVGGFAMR